MSRDTDTPDYATVDHFDRQLGQLDSLPGGVQTKPSTIQTLTPLIGAAQTWIVQTIRVPEHGDTLFIQTIQGDNKSLRLVIPPKVAEAISRQRDALTARARSKAATAVAAERKRLGIVPNMAGLEKARAARTAAQQSVQLASWGVPSRKAKRSKRQRVK